MWRGMTIYLYELAWILPSVAILAAMLVALMVTAFGAGSHVPGADGQVDPTKLAETAPFNDPGVVEVAPGRYEVRMVAGVWFFTPSEIRVPARHGDLHCHQSGCDPRPCPSCGPHQPHAPARSGSPRYGYLLYPR